MCDLSAHFYRTSYVYIRILAACVAVACVRLHLFTIRTYPLQHTINWLYTDRLPLLWSVQTVQIDKPVHSSESLTRRTQLTDHTRTDYPCYGLYRPYRLTGWFDSLYLFIYLFTTHYKLHDYDYKKIQKCRKQWRGGLKETIKLMLIRPPQLQIFQRWHKNYGDGYKLLPEGN